MLSNFTEAWRGEPPSLVATWKKYWATHIILRHSSGDRFALKPAILFPAPFPDDTESKPFMVDHGELATSAKFIFSPVSPQGLQVDGIAIKGGWGASPLAKELEGEDMESAEVWFDKVANL